MPRALKPELPSDLLPSDAASAPAGEPDDAALCARALAGDEEAYRMVFERHAPAVRRFAGNLLRDPLDADEVTQETFVRAHARLGRLRDGQRVRAWLLGIARIVTLDLLTARRRHAQEVPALPFLVDLDATPEARLLDAEADAVLAGELGRLSPTRRAALLLRLDHELPYDEIGEAMGWSLQKVKNELHRARLQLRARVLAYLKGGR